MSEQVTKSFQKYNKDMFDIKNQLLLMDQKLLMIDETIRIRNGMFDCLKADIEEFK